MAQEDGRSSSAGAEERQGAGGPEGGDQVPEEPGGRTRAKHLLARRRYGSAKHGERKTADTFKSLSKYVHKYLIST